MGVDLKLLVQNKKLVFDHVRVNADEIVEAGGYNLDALFIRLGAAIDAVGAKRIVLDTIESLFSSLPNPSIVRAELRRLFRWIKDKGVTAIVTGESGQHTLTRDGLEEYVSDCVIELSLHIDQRLASRGLRIVKYRGSEHGANEFPFVIDSSGFSLIPITSGRLDYTVNAKRLSTGIEGLDLMLGGKGFFRAVLYWFLAHRGRESPPSWPSFPKVLVCAMNVWCISPSRSHPARSVAICHLLASLLSNTKAKVCFTLKLPAHHKGGWTCICCT